MRYLTIIILLVISSLSLAAKDIWYKTDFPDSLHVQQFYIDGGDLFILSDKGALFKMADSLHFEQIADAKNGIKFNSVYFSDQNDSKLGSGFFAGTDNNGIMMLTNGEWMQYNSVFNNDNVKIIGKIVSGPFIDIIVDNSKLYEFGGVDTNRLYYDFGTNSIIYYGKQNNSDRYLIMTHDSIFITEYQDPRIEPYLDISNVDSPSRFIDSWAGFFIIGNNKVYSNYTGVLTDTVSCYKTINASCLASYNGSFPTVFDDSSDVTFHGRVVFFGTIEQGVYQDETCDYFNDGLMDFHIYDLCLYGFDNISLFAATSNNGVFRTRPVSKIWGDVKTISDNCSINIAPNPSTTNTQILTNNGSPISSIRIYDIFGNMVLETNGNQSAELSVDLSALPAGTYYCKAVIGGKIVVKKIMKI